MRISDQPHLRKPRVLSPLRSFEVDLAPLACEDGSAHEPLVLITDAESDLLTHLNRMESPTVIKWNSQFLLIKGCWVVFFIFIQISIEHAVRKQWRPQNAASDVDLRCLPMHRKKDARLIWVKQCKRYIYSD